MEFMGHADLPQQAKHNASVQALPYLHQMADIKPPAKAAAIPNNSQAKQATETASMTKEGKNVIMVLNEIAMQQQVCIDWNIVDEDGPPHMRAFTYTLKMGSYEVSTCHMLKLQIDQTKYRLHTTQFESTSGNELYRFLFFLLFL